MPTSLQPARLALPELGDSRRFIRFAGVPLLDPRGQRVMRDGRLSRERVAPERLATIARNSQRRCEAGNLGLIFVGHSHTDKDWPEHQQPPLVGYVANYRVGRTGDGTPTILADLYVRREQRSVVCDFPVRSVELYGKDDPDGYIDAVALLKRAPRGESRLERYSSDRIPEFSLPLGRLERRGNPMAMTEYDVERVADRVVAKLGSLATDFETEVRNEGPGELDTRAVEQFAKAHPELDRNNHVALVQAYLASRGRGTETRVPEQFSKSAMTDEEIRYDSLSDYAREHPGLKCLTRTQLREAMLRDTAWRAKNQKKIAGWG